MEIGNILIGLLVVFFIVVCGSLILVILIQRPQGGGLGGAFGGGSGSGQTAFGAKVGDVLTYATIAIFIAFLLSAIALTYVLRPATEEPSLPAIGTGEPVTELPAEDLDDEDELLDDDAEQPPVDESADDLTDESGDDPHADADQDDGDAGRE